MTPSPSSAFGWLLGWAAVALGGAVAIVLRHDVFDRPGLVLFYDAGHALALGGLAAVVAAFADRFGPRRAWLRTALLGVAVCAVGAVILAEELTGPADRLATRAGLPPRAVHFALVVAASLLVPAAAVVGRLFRGRRLRWTAAVAAVGLGTVHHFLLVSEYPGAHLLLAAIPATFAGSALVRVRPPARRWGLGLTAAVAVWALAAVVVPPSNAIAMDLRRVTGATLAPWLARARLPEPSPIADAVMEDTSPADVDRWFRSRAEASPQPPSGPRLAPEDPIILLLGIDSMRADLLTDPAHAAKLPHLSELAAESVRFTEARAPGSQTVYTWTQVFTGTYFSQQYWTEKKARGRMHLWPHEDEMLRFPRLLAEAGIPTVNVTPAVWMVNDYGVVRGFTEENYVKPKRGLYASGERLTDAIAERLRAHEGGPLFLFTHYLDPHAPYNSAGTDGSKFDRYLREVALVDRHIGRLRSVVEAEGLTDRVVWIICSDHGQAFGQHGTWTHAQTLYEELVRVPLIIHVPAVEPRTVTTPVSLIDLGPTILDLVGLTTPPQFLGESLVPFLRGETPELTRPIAAEGRLKRAMLFSDGKKAIFDQRSGVRELYDLRTDPEEARNLYDEESAESRERMRKLDTFFEVHRIRRPGYKIPYRR